MLVGFSGGPDSCALLLGLCLLRPWLGHQVIAAHLDHALDPGSAARRRHAAALAARLGAPFWWERRDVGGTRRPGTTIEEAARHERYAYLAEAARESGARWIATAHHREDQLETLLLRLLQGTGPLGLAGIRPRAGDVVRPLLRLPRAVLLAAGEAANLEPVQDPTNLRLDTARNRLRLLVLPRLLEREPNLAAIAATLADAARGAGTTLDRSLRALLEVEPSATEPPSPTVAISALRALPGELLPFALAALHRWSGAAYPPSGAACRGLARQLARGERADGDCGAGWRWRARGDRLQVEPPPDGLAPSRILCDSRDGSLTNPRTDARRADPPTGPEPARF